MSRTLREELAGFKVQLDENTRLTRETHQAVMGEGDKPGLKGRVTKVETKLNVLWALFTLGIPWMAKQVYHTLKS